MAEILYCPINNEVYLFAGRFKFDHDNGQLVISLESDDPKKARSVDSRSLVHIGWL